ncbi:MAG: prolyl oligopeptidase family serine peptidase [Gemmatimonadetes bacterium]|nr:prolyl oligopeptidase family serine peptidase [Gemmatimonadota bacterium]
MITRQQTLASSAPTMRLSRLLILSSGVVLFSSAASAQRAKPPTFDLTIANIMRGPEHYGREPGQVRWSPDGEWIYFQWLPPETDWRETAKPYRVRAQAGAVPERVADAEMERLTPIIANGVLSPDRSRKLTQARGDLWLVDMRTSAVRRLTETVAAESNGQFSSDGSRVSFVRDGNAYSVDLASGATRQLTDIRPGAAGVAGAAAAGGRGGRGGRAGVAPPVGAQGAGRGGRGRGANQQRTVMEREQQQLFAVLRDRARADSIRRAGERDDPDLPRTVNLGADESVQQISVSPSGAAVIFTTATSAAGTRATIVPSYVTASGYTEDIPSRTDVGDVQGSGRMGFMTLPRGEVVWIQPISGSSDSVATQGVMGWNDAGTAAIVSATARNWKTLQYSVVDGAAGSLKTIEVVHDTAWVGGPCGQCAGWYDGGRRVYWVSETNGWAQLHTAAADGTDRRETTGLGKWEVYDVALSADKNHFLYHSSELSPFDRGYYRVAVSGGAREAITPGIGGHQVMLSPDEKRMADVFSTNVKPPELYVSGYCAAGVRCEPETPARLTLSPNAEYLAGPWTKELRIVQIPASDGVQVPAHIIRPQDVGARPNGAAVIFVHGAGYLHNVHHYWPSYPREQMFNHFLASKGYTVLDIDYRASAGYGRDWRTAIYRWMGGRDLADHVDGSKWLTKQYGISPERIGMYGGSYGGFMTLMALFTEPKSFGAGAALRSVTDWAHYNHRYTSQILNQPQDDTLAYHRSSPIFLAEGLEDPLLMLHGMVDTNVHFQDVVRLTQRLIELGKTDWSLAPYPVENHGFERPDSWTDEYRRIFELFESTIGPKGTKARR